MLPRSIWLIALIYALSLAPAFAQRKQPVVGIVPPQPVQLNVKVQRGGKTEIPLRIHGMANEPLKYLIRTPPTSGKVSDPRSTGRETATAIYEPTADLTVTTDRFLYAVQSTAGVSAPVEISVTIVDLPPQLTIPDALEFPTQQAGGTSSKLLEITNSGGGLAAGDVIVEAPWRIEGKTGYRLGAGDVAIFKVIFAPTVGGTFESVARFTSDPAHSTTLRGVGEMSVAAVPAQVALQPEEGEPTRSGTFELTNQTDEPRTLQLKGDDRIEVPAQVTVPARGRVAVPVKTVSGDVRGYSGEIRVVGTELDFRVPVKAPVPGAIVRAKQPALAFGQLPVGRAASVRFELENIGGAPADVAWTIAPPFRTAQNSTVLVPGEKRAFDLEIDSKTPGKFRGWLQCKVGMRSFELPVEAEVVGGMRPRNTPAATTNPSAPTSPETNLPTPTEIEENTEQFTKSPVPEDWFGDPLLPSGVKITKMTPDSATLEWPASLSPESNFRIDLRQFSAGADGNLEVSWLELSGLPIKRDGQVYTTTIRELQPAQPWTVRVTPLKDNGEIQHRIFAIDFTTPPKPSLLPEFSLLPMMITGLIALIVWQIVIRIRQR